MKTWAFGLLAAGLLAGLTRPANGEGIEGRWESDEEATMEFFGNRIGRHDRAEYFQYSFQGEDRLIIAFANGSTVTSSVVFTEGTLHLTEENGEAATYFLQDSQSGTCAYALRQVAGAKALYAQDHPDQQEPMIIDLMAYLLEIPTCPEGGVFMIHPVGRRPLCSVHREP